MSGVSNKKGMAGQSLSMAPAIGVALAPKLTCPACWPAYAWLLGVFGVEFINYTPYLAPLMALFLALAIAPMVFQAKSRRSYGPLALGLTAVVVTMAGKFWFNSDLAMYGGLALLVTASIWNMWPKSVYKSPHCPACVRETGASELTKTQEDLYHGNQT